MAIITTEEYKAWVGETGTGFDALFGVLIASIQADLELLCGRFFEQSTYTDEAYSGRGEDTLWLRNYPVDSVSAVKILGTGGDTETLASSEYRLVGSRYICRLNDLDSSWDSPSAFRLSVGPVFPRGGGNILVTYTGGYATIPDDLKLVAYKLVDAALDSRGDNLTLAQSSDGVQQRTYLAGDAYATAKRELIRHWVREA